MIVAGQLINLVIVSTKDYFLNEEIYIEHKEKNIKGVNLVELMISLSILSIIVALASPSFTDWLGTISVKNTSESIASGISLARAEAVKINQPVEFTMGDNGNWSIINSTTQATIKEKNLRSSKVTTSTVPNSRSTATFNGLGQLRKNNLDNSLPFTKITVNPAFNEDIIYGNEVILSSGGSVSICSLNPNSNNPCGD